jgi:AAA+ ATPase superfamily predicted ATPase
MMVKNLFIDRKGHLTQLTAGLKGGKAYILIAPRRMGKTTLAQEVLNQIRTDEQYLVIQIDFMRYSNSVESIAEAIIENCLNALGFMGKLKRWIKQIEFSLTLKMKYDDLEIEPLIQLFKNKENKWDLLEHSLNLIENIAHTTGKKVIVFFDEFGELSEIDEQVIKIFRSVLQLHEQVSYLFAGSQETLMAKIFVEKSGAFYRFGELVYLAEFASNEVLALLTEMKIKFEVVHGIISLFNYHPYYTARIIKDLIISPHHANSDAEFMEYISTILIPSEMGYIELQREKLSKKANALEIMINLSLQLDPYSLPLARQTIFKGLKYLETSGFIKKNGKNQYVVIDPLLRLYFSL